MLGPPRMAFASSTSVRNTNKLPLDSPDRPPLRDADSRDRFNFRNIKRDGETETREGRSNLLRPKRAEGEDNEGWSTVKPRKSFGTEGAERFNGRMGVHREDRRFKDREDRDVKDRPQRGFDSFSRDKDVENQQESEVRRNGAGRGRTESWFRTENDGPPTPRDRNSNGDRFTNRGWREKDDRDRVDNRNDRGDRRWGGDREQKQEREPEWFDEPADDKSQTHTQEDFQKWKDQMQGKDKASSKTPMEDKNDGGGFFGLEKPKIETPLAIDTGPDKFFGMWATPTNENGPGSGIEAKKDGPVKSQTVGKASRFTSFFAQEEPPRSQTVPNPAVQAPPSAGGLGPLFPGVAANAANDPNEKAAFAELLQKLKGNSLAGSGSTPPANVQQQPKPPASERQQSHPIIAPEPFQQYRPERHEERGPSSRNSQLQDMLAQRQASASVPVSRPEQMLQELVSRRETPPGQLSVRPDQPSRNNTEFLMNLMQSAKAAPEPQRTEQLLLRMPPGQKQNDRVLQQQMLEEQMQREAAAQRSANQRQARPPPGFFDDPGSFQRGPPPQHERQPQPTQILQRPPPPGLDGPQIPSWAQQPGPQQIRQHIAPPPGLGATGPEMRSRGMPPMQQQMFPPGFPGFPPNSGGGFQGPEGMGGPPRMQPPPGFYAPPGFMAPPGMNGGGFAGPEGMAFGGPGFDSRGMPPSGFRRQ